MTTTVTVETSDHAVNVIAHNSKGDNIQEKRVEPNSTDIFYAHHDHSISITEIHETGQRKKTVGE